jgi:hypothetical protein
VFHIIEQFVALACLEGGLKSCITNLESKLHSFGFRFGKTSVHTSRTMMLSELTLLLSAADANATQADYTNAIIEDNLLGKTTVSSRNLTAERLVELYSIDADICLFRVLRHFWRFDEASRPVLALLLALARDTLLRPTADLILKTNYGEQLSCTDMVVFLDVLMPGRFSRATTTSVAQNINSTWTQAGYLTGRIKKIRTEPVITPASLTFALFMAYLEGARAQRLFESYWVRVLNISKDKAHDLASAASQQGWLDYRRAGDVIDIRFPDLLTAHEQELLSEQT